MLDNLFERVRLPEDAESKIEKKISVSQMKKLLKH